MNGIEPSALANATNPAPQSEIPQSVSSDIDVLLGWIGDKIKVRESQDDEDEAQCDQRIRKARLDNLLRHVGRRYADCTLGNFRVSHPSQSKVLGKVCRYVANMESHIQVGSGLILFGPPGTGKDHLLIGAIRVAIEQGYTAVWANAQDFFGSIREAIDTDTPESKVLLGYTLPSILVLSDPVPQFGRLSEHQANMLWRVIDRRYRDCKPTWMTLNVRNGEEAAERIGASLVDRLRDGATYAFCDWESHRKPST